MAEHSPTGSFVRRFSKARNGRRTSKDSSQAAIERVDSSTTAGSDNSGVRGSLESSSEKLQHYPTNDSGDGNGLKRILSKSLTPKRRQKREEELRIREEVARGRSVAERGTLQNDDDHVVKGSEDDSSLYTDDYSDTEEAPDDRPPLSNHPSQAEGRTKSLPVIQVSGENTETQLDQSPRASVTIDTLATPDISPVPSPGALRAPTDGSLKRSPSPVGRLKEALKNRRGTSPNTSPERQSNSSSAGSHTKEKSGANSRRGSVASKFPLIFPEKQQGDSAPSSVASSPERPRTTKIQKIDTSAVPPRTPPSEDSPAPLIVNTPPTPTDHRVPRISSPREKESPKQTTHNPDVVVSPSGNMISHRRVRSSSATLVPSKLSNITSAPLSPTPENSTPPIISPSSGFFSTVFSAAQNAANTISNSIANTSVKSESKGKNAKEDTKGTRELDAPEVESAGEKADTSDQAEQKELAVKTLGLGDLSLSQLGIPEVSAAIGAAMGSKSSDDAREKSDIDDESHNVAPQGVLGYSVENNSTTTVDEGHNLTRPRSMYEPSTAGDQTPPNGSVADIKANLQSTGSVRSAIGRKRRTRGSSAATGTAIGAAIAAANASVAHPSANNTPKITGFAVASKKRNRDFHQLFRSVPDDDYLIEDYSCALQREILAHGRLYVSEGHLCFSSNIFGWVTTLVMSFDEIVSVEKRSTALVFKNGLMISTLHSKNIFASFTSRDSTYDLIVGIWKLGHPSIHSSLNGVRLDGAGGGDKTEKDDILPNGSQSGSDSEGDSEDEDEVYDEDEEEDDGFSVTHGDVSIAGSDEVEKAVSRKPSGAVVLNGGLQEEVSAGSTADFPGPAAHAPTDCTDRDTHYDKILSDEVIPAPLGKVYNLMFGPASGAWMRQWLISNQKCTDVTLEGGQMLTAENKVRTYSYIKPLYGAIGPKSTKCVCSENLDAIDLERAVSVTISTQTPDVPSGNVFSTKTKYCLTWAEGNSTRLQMNCTIEWTGKSWLKGPIEKGANDGQVQFAKDIIAALKVAISRRGASTAPNGTRGKKKGRKGREPKTAAEPTGAAADAKPSGRNLPFKGILGPVVDMVQPLLTPNVIYAVLIGLLIVSWLRFPLWGNSDHRRVGLHGGLPLSSPERIAAYEELWRREESELWDWLDQRIGMERLRDVRAMPLEAKIMDDKLRDQEMNAREVDDAIRVTEERLQLLKEVIKKKHGQENVGVEHVEI